MLRQIGGFYIIICLGCILIVFFLWRKMHHCTSRYQKKYPEILVLIGKCLKIGQINFLYQTKMGEVLSLGYVGSAQALHAFLPRYQRYSSHFLGCREVYDKIPHKDCLGVEGQIQSQKL